MDYLRYTLVDVVDVAIGDDVLLEKRLIYFRSAYCLSLKYCRLINRIKRTLEFYGK